MSASPVPAFDEALLDALARVHMELALERLMREMQHGEGQRIQNRNDAEVKPEARARREKHS